ncbi:hypothetical protein CALVIDRAFT_541881 [Calocera viscosa TUFC12733]|uniref:F-box domain-containing protein n=1 Tax=Calocera viscosa (strain TUFC12733) TaxID=1330018 RepID=A0A167H8M5_CALVF|nr:hypothetical protein CALVIDRAFT_541881 [Calocera viscosa TUFC12733]
MGPLASLRQPSRRYHQPETQLRSVHRALFMEDIMRPVYESLDCRTLCAVSQTAKSFFGLSTGVLWSRVYEVEILLGVIPEHLRRLLLDGNNIPAEHLYQLERIRHYVSATRTLRMVFEEPAAGSKEDPRENKTYQDLDICSRTLQALSRLGSRITEAVMVQTHPWPSLFPSLMVVHLQCYSKCQWELGQLILSDTVLSLEATLEWDMSEDEAQAAIRLIADRCPNLRHLDLRCWQIRTIQAFTKLRLWSLGMTYAFVRESEIDVLASMKTLRHLSLLVETDDPDITPKSTELPRASDQTAVYSSLDHLDSLMIRTGESLYLCIAMIYRLQAHNLRALHIDAECVSDRLLRACVQAISDRCLGLYSLYWHARTQSSELKAGELRNWRLLEPIAACREITSFQFSSSAKEDCTTFTWDDEDLQAISQVWPGLQKLRLVALINAFDYESERYRPRITWRGLAILAKNCPHLQLAQLEFDASDFGWPSEDIVPAEDLEMLCLAWTRMDGDDYETVARRIHQLWPNANVGWGLWYGGQVERPDDHSEDIVNRFPDLNDTSYEQALKVAFSISHYLYYVKQEEAMDPSLSLEEFDHNLYYTMPTDSQEQISVRSDRFESTAGNNPEDSWDSGEISISWGQMSHATAQRARGQSVRALWTSTLIDTTAGMNHWIIQPLRRVLHL